MNVREKQLAYDLTLEAVRSNNLMKNIDEENVENRINYISEKYKLLLEEIKKANMDL